MRKHAISATILLLLLIPLSLAFAEDDKHKFEDFEGKQAKEFPKWAANGSVGYNTSGGYVDTTNIVADLLVTHDRQWTGHQLKGGIAYGTVTYPDGDPIKNVNNYFGNYKIEAYVYKNRKPYFWGLGGALRG